MRLLFNTALGNNYNFGITKNIYFSSFLNICIRKNYTHMHVEVCGWICCRKCDGSGREQHARVHTPERSQRVVPWSETTTAAAAAVQVMCYLYRDYRCVVW